MSLLPPIQIYSKKDYNISIMCNATTHNQVPLSEVITSQ